MKKYTHPKTKWVYSIMTDGSVEPLRIVFPRKGMFFFLDYRNHSYWQTSDSKEAKAQQAAAARKTVA